MTDEALQGVHWNNPCSKRQLLGSKLTNRNKVLARKTIKKSSNTDKDNLYNGKEDSQHEMQVL